MGYEFDFCVVITTYNRPQMLVELLDEIEREKKDYKVLVVVCDDNSDQRTDLSKYNIRVLRMYPNMGKKKYYNTINTTFKYIKNINSKYYVYLPDDVKLTDNFFNETKRIFESINDNNKICLSVLTDIRITRTNWTNYRAVDYGEYYKTQWNDLCFIAEKRFFDVLNYKIETIDESRWIKNPNLSSGVGHQISIKLHEKGYGMYHTKKSMVFHGNHESQMNKIERKRVNLITN